MSNPAVIKLQQKTIGKSRVWMDDNFGEAVHLHIDQIRVDLGVEEFDAICKDIALSLNEMIDVEGFDCCQIDPVYLEVMLADKLLKLRSIKMDRVYLEDLLAPGRRGIKPLADSRAVRALKGDSKENDIPRASHHIGQTSKERLSAMMASIEEHGYPYGDNYIVLYGDDNIIRDGQHRAACLYSLKGNIQVPVMRFYFDGYEKENVKLSGYRFYKIYVRLRDHGRKMRGAFLKTLIADVRIILGMMKKKMASVYKAMYARVNKSKVNEANQVLKNR